LSGADTAAALVALSFVSFVLGFVFRKWPERVQVHAEAIDGSAHLFSPRTHRLVIELAGSMLIAVSFATLLAAALTL
jgi:hypothetical protein